MQELLTLSRYTHRRPDLINVNGLKPIIAIYNFTNITIYITISGTINIIIIDIIINITINITITPQERCFRSGMRLLKVVLILRV